MSNQEWRVLDGEGNEQGPYSTEDLQSYYTTGNINHETMVWTEGLEEWVPAGTVEGLLPEMPQVVPLAPAPTIAAAPLAQPVASGGINLSPQISGASSLPVGQKPKNAAPTWISAFTILSGVAALILYFFPWVSMSLDISDSPTERDMMAMVTQTGMQSVTQNESVSDDLIAKAAKESGLTEKEIKDQIEESEEEAKKQQEEAKKTSGNKDDAEVDYDRSTLNLIALIAVGIGVIISLIGFINQAKTIILISQVLFTTAAILISVQMAKQFPIVTKYIEAQEEAQKTIDEMLKFSEESAQTAQTMLEASIASATNAGDAETAAQLRKDADKQMKEMTKAINDGRRKSTERYETAFEPSCFITVGLLGCSILLLVFTMSSGETSTIMIPQPGTQAAPGQQPQQPTQPGSGLKFH